MYIFIIIGYKNNKVKKKNFDCLLFESQHYYMATHILSSRLRDNNHVFTVIFSIYKKKKKLELSPNSRYLFEI